MRILLDECAPRPLKRELADYEIRTVVELGWSGKKNGELLRLMIQEGFTEKRAKAPGFRHGDVSGRGL
jgi:hypothetical protein